MNLEKFHSVLIAIKNDVENLDLSAKLNQLQSTLEQSVNQPNATNAQAFRDQYADITQTLALSSLNFLHPSQAKILFAIRADEYVGFGLMQRIEKIISSNNVTPANALKEITSLNQEVKKYFESVSNLVETFSELELEPDSLAVGQAEVGILIPPELAKSSLEGLQNEVKRLDAALKTFGEIATGDTSSLKIRHISSSDYQVFLDAAPKIAAFVAVAIERLVALYKKILEIKKLRQEIAKQEVPKDVTKPFEEYEKKVEEEEIDKLARQLVQEYHRKDDKGRENELITALNKALTYLVTRIDKGVVVEVRVQEPEEPEKPEETEEETPEFKKQLSDYQEQKKLAEEINKRGRTLGSLQKQDTPILMLSSRPDEEEDSKQKK